MSKFILSCCSTADLSKEHLDRREISYICFHYSMDGVNYVDDLGQSMSFEDFYARMAKGAETKTSQVGIGEYEDYFASLLSQGYDVLHVSLSSGLSGSYKSALIASEMLKERFPDRKLYLVDSLGASSGYGLIMDTLADMRDNGMSIDELYDWVSENKLRLHHWFFSTDLTYYVKGGRISKTAGWIGGLLDICPLLNMDENGKLVPRAKVRTKKRVLSAIVDRMADCAENGTDYDGKCFISCSACFEDARAVADMIEARFPKLNGKVLINNIGTTIGSHTGPGTVAVFFWGTKREAANAVSADAAESRRERKPA